MTTPIAPWHATCVQMPTEIVWPLAPDEVEGVIAHNVEVAIDAVTAAATADPAPALVLLPEYAFTGQPSGGTVADWLARGCSPVPGPLTVPFSALAREHGIYIGGNQFEYDPEWPDRFFNTSWLIAPDGEVVIRYRRIHTAMWCSPHDVWEDYLGRYGGKDAVWPVVDTPLGRIAMVPCGEISVPEVTRTVALRGAEVLLHPTWEIRTPGQDANKIAAASNNGMYVISANVASSRHRGVVDDRPSNAPVGSGSRIIGPNGVTLVEADHHDATLISAEIDVESVRTLRNSLTMANPLLRLRVETIVETYQETSIYPPNAFLDRPLDDYTQIDGPAAVAREQLTRLAAR